MFTWSTGIIPSHKIHENLLEYDSYFPHRSLHFNLDPGTFNTQPHCVRFLWKSLLYVSSFPFLMTAYKKII